MKKILYLYLLFSIYLLTSCSNNDPISCDEQKKNQVQQLIKSRTIYPLGTSKKDIDFDIEVSPDTLIRIYDRDKVRPGDVRINPQTVFCLTNGVIRSILIEYHPYRTNDQQLVYDVSCFDPSLNLALQTIDNLAIALKVDSVKGKCNDTPILIRNGFMHSSPEWKAIVIAYGPAS